MPRPGPPLLHSEQRHRVRLLTLNRPERRNAMLPELMDALADHLQALALLPTDDLQAVVLTGAAPAFCVGADLKWLATLPDPAEGVAQLVAAHHRAVRALRQAPVPVIAAVNGPAAGGGLSLALACDYALAAESATLTPAYFALDLTPDGGNSAFLTRALGPTRALALLLQNPRLPAREAHHLGLVAEVTPDHTLLDRATTLSETWQPVSPTTLRQTRHLLDTASSAPLDTLLDLEATAIHQAAQTPTFRARLHKFVSPSPLTGRGLR